MKSRLQTIIGSALTLAIFAPSFAFAQYIPQGGDLKGLFFGLLGFLKYIPEAIFAAAIILFLLSIINMYFFTIDFLPKVEDGKKGKTLFMYIMALFVMFSIYGILAVLSNTTGIGQGGQTPARPEIPIFDPR